VSTKLHAIVDTSGRPLYVTITQGQRHEMIRAKELLEHARGTYVLGDSGYDSNEFLESVRGRDMIPVIHSGSGRKRKLRLNRALYRRRYIVECFFHTLKRFRAVATRYEKTARNYLALIQLACARIWLGSDAS
jgi:transposase